MAQENQVDIDFIKEHLKKAKTRSEFQRLQCIYLRMLRPDYTAGDIAKIVCMSTIAVKKIHSKYLKTYDITVFNESRGGRYRQYINIYEERDFLISYFKKIVQAHVEIKNLRNEFENKFSHKIADSTICRMLDRHSLRLLVKCKP